MSINPELVKPLAWGGEYNGVIISHTSFGIYSVCQQHDNILLYFASIGNRPYLDRNMSQHCESVEHGKRLAFDHHLTLIDALLI